MSEEDYYKFGERSFNIQRAIYGREGRAGRKDDTLNEFNFTEPVENQTAYSVCQSDLSCQVKAMSL